MAPTHADGCAVRTWLDNFHRLGRTNRHALTRVVRVHLPRIPCSWLVDVDPELVARAIEHLAPGAAVINRGEAAVRSQLDAEELVLEAAAFGDGPWTRIVASCHHHRLQPGNRRGFC